MICGYECGVLERGGSAVDLKPKFFEQLTPYNISTDNIPQAISTTEPSHEESQPSSLVPPTSTDRHLVVQAIVRMFSPPTEAEKDNNQAGYLASFKNFKKNYTIYTPNVGRPTE
jgi:hypothetical protein